MKRFRQFAIIGFLTLACSPRVHAHALLDHSEPMAGQALATSPEELRMWFTQPVKAALSTIEVFDVEGKQVDKRDLHTNKANAKVALTNNSKSYVDKSRNNQGRFAHKRSRNGTEMLLPRSAHRLLSRRLLSHELRGRWPAHRMRTDDAGVSGLDPPACGSKADRPPGTRA